MTSTTLVPYTFSLLKLPFVALQNVADCLNPFEIYHFSRISKKTNKLARVFSKKATRIFLISHSRVAVQFNESGTWSFEPIMEPGPDFYAVHRGRPIYAYFSKKPASEVLRVLERVVDILKNSKVHLHFCTQSSSRQDLITYFNWCMVNPSEVPYVFIWCRTAEDVQFFLENYKKPSKKLYLKLQFGNEEQLELPDNLETTLFEEVKIRNFHAVNFNLYNIFSCSTINSYERQLTSRDLNTFLKNWQSGLTNSHWRSVCIIMMKRVILKDVLKDITATYRDPQTVKRQVSTAQGSCWIFGGIDIHKHDGTATATIQWKEYRVEKEDSEVPNEFIEEYKRNQETGEIQHNKSYKFSMIVW